MQSKDGEVIITNDGATIMSHMQVRAAFHAAASPCPTLPRPHPPPTPAPKHQVFHPTAKMLVELSKAQDIEAGDGTTSVVVMCGSMLDQCGGLLDKGIHPTVITEAFQMAAVKAEEVLTSVATPVDLRNREQLIKAATTSLASKVVSSSSEDLAPLAVDAVLSIIDPLTADNVDLNNVKVVKALGGTIDETELVHGLVFTNKVSHVAAAPTRVEKAKIGLIQFCLSSPKTDIENQVVVSEYSQMDRLLREERAYVLDLVNKIHATGCNVLLVQKSILRDSVTGACLTVFAYTRAC